MLIALCLSGMDYWGLYTVGIALLNPWLHKWSLSGFYPYETLWSQKKLVTRVRDNRSRNYLEKAELSDLSHMHRQSLRLVVEEGVSRKCGAEVHDEVVQGAVAWVNEVGLVLQQLVYALREFGIRKAIKKLVISPLFYIFIFENQ